MARKILIAIIILAIAMTAAIAYAAPTDKEKLLEYYAKRTASSLEYTYKITVDKEPMSTALVKMKGQKMYMETTMEEMKSFMINDGLFMYMWTSMSNIGQKYDLKDYENQGEANKEDIEQPDVQVKVLGYETVNGYQCMKVEIKIEGTVQYHWVSEKYGLSIRVIMEDMQMDITDIKEKNIPDSTFVPPSNINFSGNMFAGLGQAMQQAAQQSAQQAAQAVDEAIAQNKPISKGEFLAIMAKRGSIPAVYTEKYDNLLKTKVSVSVKGGKEYRVVDAAIKLYMMCDGTDIYTWNSMIKTVTKVKVDDVALKVLSPYDPTIMYAKDFSLYEYIGRDEINGEQCRHARVFYSGKTYEIWVSERLGILMRLIVGDVDMTVSTVIEQDIPDTTFQFPSGYKVK